MRARLGDLLFSLLFGWWGFPWGFLMTPVQLARNIAGLVSSPDTTRPSAQLARMVRLHLAANAIEAQQKQRA